MMEYTKKKAKGNKKKRSGYMYWAEGVEYGIEVIYWYGQRSSKAISARRPVKNEVMVILGQ